MKKALSFLLAVSMLLSISVSAFADSNRSLYSQYGIIIKGEPAKIPVQYIEKLYNMNPQGETAYRGMLNSNQEAIVFDSHQIFDIIVNTLDKDSIPEYLNGFRNQEIVVSYDDGTILYECRNLVDSKMPRAVGQTYTKSVTQNYINIPDGVQSNFTLTSTFAVGNDLAGGNFVDNTKNTTKNAAVQAGSKWKAASVKSSSVKSGGKQYGGVTTGTWSFTAYSPSNSKKMTLSNTSNAIH